MLKILTKQIVFERNIYYDIGLIIESQCALGFVNAQSVSLYHAKNQLMFTNKSFRAGHRKNGAKVLLCMQSTMQCAYKVRYSTEMAREQDHVKSKKQLTGQHTLVRSFGSFQDWKRYQLWSINGNGIYLENHYFTHILGICSL